MKKIILILLLPFIVKSQRTFINETTKQVENFWRSKTLMENIHIEKDDKGRIRKIYIMVGNIGSASFTADFAEDGKCGYSITETKDSKVFEITSNMKKNGYVFDKKESTWYNDKKQIAITIKDVVGEKCELIAQAYWVQ